MATASLGYFAISKETVPGTAITTPAQFYPTQSVDFPYENQYLDNYEIRGSRQAMTSERGLVEGNATVSGLFYPQGAGGTLLYALFGAVDSNTITTAYKHDFTSGPLASYTLERADAFATEGGIFAERLAGAKMESFNLECTVGELVTYTANFQAMKAPALVTAATRPVGDVWGVGKAVGFTGATISVNGSPNATFTSLSLEMMNTLTREPVLNGLVDGHSIDEAGFSVTLSGNALFKDLALRTLLENGTEFEVEMAIHNGVDAEAGEKERIELIFPKVKLASVGIPMQANEVITSDVTFKVDFDDTAAAMVQAALINTEDGTDYD
jgi:hypothetical protein